MPITPDPTLYVTESDLQKWMGNEAPDFAARVAGVPAAVSRQIDAWCGRRFYADTTPSARTYRPACRTSLLFIDDCYDIDSITIDGTAVASDDYIVFPENGVSGGIEGWPASYLEGVWSGTVVVTGKWGWSQVPAQVTQAALLLGAESTRSGDLPGGYPDFVDTGNAAVRRAFAMLGPLRDVALA